MRLKPATSQCLTSTQPNQSESHLRLRYLENSKVLAEIQHAVVTVIAEIHREQLRLSELHAELAVLNATTDDGYRQAEFLAMNPVLDDEGLGTAIHWDTYFGVDKDRFHKSAEVELSEQRVAAREFSVAALSGVEVDRDTAVAYDIVNNPGYLLVTFKLGAKKKKVDQYKDIFRASPSLQVVKCEWIVRDKKLWSWEGGGI